jgi:hypothetical protein
VVIYGGRDCENRPPSARRLFKPAVGERVLVHASLGMTAAEYENAAAFMASIGVRRPQRRALQFGGMIGFMSQRKLLRD